MRSFALYRGRSLLIFNGTQERDEYMARFFRWENVQPLTEQEADAWTPRHREARKIAVWRNEQGRWTIRTIRDKHQTERTRP